MGTNQIKRALKQGYTSLEICQNHLHLCSKDQIDDDYEEIFIDMESMSRWSTADPDSIPEHEGQGSRSNTPEPSHPAAAMENEKDIFGNVDNDEMDNPDSHENEDAKTTRATSVRRQTQSTIEDYDATAGDVNIDSDVNIYSTLMRNERKICIKRV
jgi:hypothetical protein